MEYQPIYGIFLCPNIGICIGPRNPILVRLWLKVIKLGLCCVILIVQSAFCRSPSCASFSFMEVHKWCCHMLLLLRFLLFKWCFMNLSNYLKYQNCDLLCTDFIFKTLTLFRLAQLCQHYCFYCVLMPPQDSLLFMYISVFSLQLRWGKYLCSNSSCLSHESWSSLSAAARSQRCSVRGHCWFSWTTRGTTGCINALLPLLTDWTLMIHPGYGSGK